MSAGSFHVELGFSISGIWTLLGEVSAKSTFSDEDISECGYVRIELEKRLIITVRMYAACQAGLRTIADKFKNKHKMCKMQPTIGRFMRHNIGSGNGVYPTRDPRISKPWRASTMWTNRSHIPMTIGDMKDAYGPCQVGSAARDSLNQQVTSLCKDGRMRGG